MTIIYPVCAEACMALGRTVSLITQQLKVSASLRHAPKMGSCTFVPHFCHFSIHCGIPNVGRMVGAGGGGGRESRNAEVLVLSIITHSFKDVAMPQFTSMFGQKEKCIFNMLSIYC